jgi:hypothetical protein
MQHLEGPIDRAHRRFIGPSSHSIMAFFEMY